MNMATVKTKTAETTYVLELTEREAAALCELLLAVNINKGEGPQLQGIYNELTDAGAEGYELQHEVDEDGDVVVTRDE